MTYRVKCHPPEPTQPQVLVPKSASLNCRRLREHDCEHGARDEQAKASARTSLWTNGMSDTQADHGGAEIAKVVDYKGQEADLVDDVAVAVKCGDGDAFGPRHEEQAKVVGPGVDGVQEVVAELCAEHERQEERDHGDNGADDWPRHLLGPITVDDERDHRLDEGKGGADTHEHDGDEKDDGPELGGGQVRDGLGVGKEANSKSAQFVTGLWLQVQISNDAKDGEGGKDLVEGVAATDDDSVLDCVCDPGVVRRKGGEVAKTNAG